MTSGFTCYRWFSCKDWPGLVRLLKWKQWSCRHPTYREACRAAALHRGPKGEQGFVFLMPMCLTTTNYGPWEETEAHSVMSQMARLRGYPRSVLDTSVPSPSPPSRGSGKNWCLYPHHNSCWPFLQHLSRPGPPPITSTATTPAQALSSPTCVIAVASSLVSLLLPLPLYSLPAGEPSFLNVSPKLSLF